MTNDAWLTAFAIGGPAAVSLSAGTRAPWTLIATVAGAGILSALSPYDLGRTIVMVLVPVVGALVAVGSRDPRMTPASVVGASFGAVGQFALIYFWQAATFFLTIPLLLLAMRLAPRLPTRMVPWVAVLPTLFLAVAIILAEQRS